MLGVCFCVSLYVLEFGSAVFGVEYRSSVCSSGCSYVSVCLTWCKLTMFCTHYSIVWQTAKLCIVMWNSSDYMDHSHTDAEQSSTLHLLSAVHHVSKNPD